MTLDSELTALIAINVVLAAGAFALFGRFLLRARARGVKHPMQVAWNDGTNVLAVLVAIGLIAQLLVWMLILSFAQSDR